MSRTFTARRAFIALGAIALSGVGWAAYRSISRPAPSKLVLAESSAVASALFYVARHEGYFAEEELEIETIPANSGKEALDVVIADKADICMVAEAPVVNAVTAGHQVRILATIETSERNTGIIIPAQSAIHAATDLRGLRIGYIPGTASEYFLSVYLSVNSLAVADISMIVLSPKDAHEALARGEVDAISGWQEIRARADKALGNRTRILYADGVYLETWNLAAMAPRLDKIRPSVERLVRALIRAEGFTSRNLDAAIAITADSIGVDRATIREMWPDYAFDLGLDQALITNLEGHWRTSNKSASAGKMPNLAANLDPLALEAVEPGRVTYFH